MTTAENVRVESLINSLAPPWGAPDMARKWSIKGYKSIFLFSRLFVAVFFFTALAEHFKEVTELQSSTPFKGGLQDGFGFVQEVE